MKAIISQTPISKKNHFSEIAQKIQGVNIAIFFDKKNDKDYFIKIVKSLNLKYSSKKDNGYYVWVK